MTELKNRPGVGLQLGRAQDELLPDRRPNWTELVAVWILAYFALFQFVKALPLRLLAFCQEELLQGLATSESIGDLFEMTNRRLNFRMNHPMFSTSCVDNSLLLSDLKKADGNLLENFFAKQKYLRARL